MRLDTEAGLVPIRNFMELQPTPRTVTITRIDGNRAVTIEAGVADGLLVADQIARIQMAVAETDGGG